MSQHSAFSKLARIKIEEVNLNPDIFIYHSVIYDKEIEIIKALAESLVWKYFFVYNYLFNNSNVYNQIQTAQVYDEFTGLLRSSNSRVAKSVFISDDKHKYLRDISARIEDMTGIKTKTAEPLQILNYGMGGHYDPHVDFFPSGYDEPDNHDNRIGTVLFYVIIFDVK